MDVKLRILIRTIQRRIAQGELLDDILQSYPKLSNDAVETINREIANQ